MKEHYEKVRATIEAAEQAMTAAIAMDVFGLDGALVEVISQEPGYCVSVVVSRSNRLVIMFCGCGHHEAVQLSTIEFRLMLMAMGRLPELAERFSGFVTGWRQRMRTVEEDAEGARVGVRRHLARHLPTGFGGAG